MAILSSEYTVSTRTSHSSRCHDYNNTRGADLRHMQSHPDAPDHALEIEASPPDARDHANPAQNNGHAGGWIEFKSDTVKRHEEVNTLHDQITDSNLEIIQDLEGSRVNISASHTYALGGQSEERSGRAVSRLPKKASRHSSSLRQEGHISEDINRQSRNALFQYFKAIRSHRSRLSFHWLRYREDYKYFMQDYERLMDVFAIWQQEIQTSPPGSQTFNISKLNTLGHEIKCCQNDLSSDEARLEAIQEKISEQERLLKISEERLGDQLDPVDLSDDEDEDEFVNDILTGAISLPPSPDTNSVSSAPMNEIGDMYFMPQELPALGGANEAGSNSDLMYISFPVRSNKATAKSTERAQLNHEEAVVRTIVDDSTFWKHLQVSIIDVGVQFSEPEDEPIPDEIFHIMPRSEFRHDLKDVITQVDSSKTSTELLSVDEFQNTPQSLLLGEFTMLQRLLLDFRDSWLGLSKFLYWLEWYAGQLRYLKKINPTDCTPNGQILYVRPESNQQKALHDVQHNATSTITTTNRTSDLLHPVVRSQDLVDPGLNMGPLVPNISFHQAVTVKSQLQFLPGLSPPIFTTTRSRRSSGRASSLQEEPPPSELPPKRWSTL